MVAWFLLRLLEGGPVLGLGQLTKVVTQVRAEGWLLDDLRLHLKDGVRERRVAVECKSGPVLTVQGGLARETVDRAWRLLVDGADPGFVEGRDAMWVIVREWSRTAASAWRSIVGAAGKGTSDGLRRAAPGVAKKRILEGLIPPTDLCLTADAASPARLLAHLRVSRLDLGDPGDEHDDEAVRRCGPLLDDPADARKLWDRLGRLARERQHAREWDRESLVAALRTDFTLAAFPDHRPLLDDLGRWSVEDFPERPARIGDVHVERANVHQALRETCRAQQLVALTGASGTGKTAVVRDLTPEVLGVRTMVRLRASRLTRENAPLISTALGVHPATSGILVIDAIDTDGGGVEPIALLLRALRRSAAPWTLVLVCSTARWDETWAEIRRSANDIPTPPKVEVDAFTETEVEQVLLPLGARLPPAARERLHPLLSNAWSLDRVVEVVSAGVDLSDSRLGAASLARLWWHHVLSGPDRDGSARAQAILLAPALADRGRPVRPRPAELTLLAPLLGRVLEQRPAGVQFAHARFEEIALARSLVDAVPPTAIEPWRRHAEALRWRPALALAAAEIVEDDPNRWEALVTQLNAGSPGDAALLGLLLEAPTQTGKPEASLEALRATLLAHDAVLLQGLTRRLRDRLGAAGLPTASERSGWVALVGWAARNLPSLSEGARRAIYPIIEGAGLYSRALGLCQADLGALSAAVYADVESALASGNEHRTGDRSLLGAFLAVADLDIDRTRPLVRQLCGREPRPKPPPVEAVAHRRASLPLALSSGFHDSAPQAPWPDGPAVEPVDGFSDVALTHEGVWCLHRADPRLAVEVMLALCVEEPLSREPWWLQRPPMTLLLPGFSWSARVTGDFNVPLEILAQDRWALVMFGVKAARLAATCLEAYLTETRRPAESPVILELGGARYEYAGGRELWRLGRGLAPATEVLGYALRKVAETFRVTDAMETDRAILVQLLLDCPSTASLGLLCRLIAESPGLISGPACAVLQDPRLSAWECEAFPGQRPGALVKAAEDAWFRAQMSWPALESAKRRWTTDLAGGRVPENLRAWTANLVNRFDPSRWTQEPAPDGTMTWTLQPDEAQRRRDAEIAAINQRMLAPLQMWHIARQVVDGQGWMSTEDAQRLYEATAGLPDDGIQVADTRVAVAAALARSNPTVLAEPAALQTALGWLEPAFIAAGEYANSRLVFGQVDAGAAAAWLWARAPLSPGIRRLVGLAISNDHAIALRTFFRLAAYHRTQHPGEFRRLLRAAFAFRAQWRGDVPLEQRVAFAQALADDASLAPSRPVVPPVAGYAGWLAPLTHWVREVARDEEVDAIILGVDACLRAERVRSLTNARERDGMLRRGRPTTASDLDEIPDEHEADLLVTLARWLLDVSLGRAESVLAGWFDPEIVPRGWLASLIDALYAAALARPSDHDRAASLLSGVLNRVLDDPRWCDADGALLHDLEDHALGVGYNGWRAEDWGPEAAPLLRDLRGARRRWVEHHRCSGRGVIWLCRLGRSAAAAGARAEFAGLLVQFPVVARREEHRAKHIAAYLRELVRDSSFAPPDAAAEELLADVREAGLPDAWRIEMAMRPGGAE